MGSSLRYPANRVPPWACDRLRAARVRWTIIYNTSSPHRCNLAQLDRATDQPLGFLYQARQRKHVHETSCQPGLLSKMELYHTSTPFLVQPVFSSGVTLVWARGPPQGKSGDNRGRGFYLSAGCSTCRPAYQQHKNSDSQTLMDGHHHPFLIHQTTPEFTLPFRPIITRRGSLLGRTRNELEKLRKRSLVEQWWEYWWFEQPDNRKEDITTDPLGLWKTKNKLRTPSQVISKTYSCRPLGDKLVD